SPRIAGNDLFGNYFFPARQNMRGAIVTGTPIAITTDRPDAMGTVMQRYALNLTGRDYAGGDIHGDFSRLQHASETVGFDRRKDGLLSVGDVVDRGPGAEQALDWLALPWFHAVRGNHEDYAIRHSLGGRVDIENYRVNGGGWFLD